MVTDLLSPEYFYGLFLPTAVSFTLLMQFQMAARCLGSEQVWVYEVHEEGKSVLP